MDNDPQTTSNCKGEPEEERQNRRQFFNGLGKWSLAIIAAIAALRDGWMTCRTALVRGSGPARRPRAILFSRSPGTGIAFTKTARLDTTTCTRIMQIIATDLSGTQGAGGGRGPA